MYIFKKSWKHIFFFYWTEITLYVYSLRDFWNKLYIGYLSNKASSKNLRLVNKIMNYEMYV